jgi:hypothetical protein
MATRKLQNTEEFLQLKEETVEEDFVCVLLIVMGGESAAGFGWCSRMIATETETYHVLI